MSQGEDPAPDLTYCDFCPYEAVTPDSTLCCITLFYVTNGGLVYSQLAALVPRPHVGLLLPNHAELLAQLLHVLRDV